MFVGEYSRSPFLSDRVKSSSKQNFKFKFLDGMYRVAKMHKMPEDAGHFANERLRNDLQLKAFTNCGARLRKLTYKDTATYASSPPCRIEMMSWNRNDDNDEACITP